MKKTIICAIVFLVLITCTVIGLVYKDDLTYLSSTMRRIKIDKNITTQSVMTFNVKCITSVNNDKFSWKYRAPLICDLLQEHTPSIICMQENKKEQYSFFEKFLKGYGSVATYRDATPLAECLPIFYRTDMYELIKTQTFWLSDTPDVMSNTWDLAYYRICTFVVLKNKNTDKKFIVGNVHLDYKSQETQIKSIRLIYDRLSTFNLPAIIMGDFNCTPDSNAIDFAKQFFVDAGQGFGDENKGTINYFKNEYPNIKIDYILLFPDSFTINNYKVIDKKYNGHYASDHFPVYAELT